MSKKFVLGTTALLMSMAAGTARAEKTVPIWEQDSSDAYDVTANKNTLGDAAGLIDQYGTKLDHNEGAFLGYIERCWSASEHAEHVERVVLWGLCGEDVKLVDLEKVKNDNTKYDIDKLKKVGAAIEAEAKDDPGVALILKQTEQAKADWKTFEAQNHDALVLYQKLKDGVRSSKANDKNFEGCWDATQPAFAKLVRATKFHWDSDTIDHVEEVIGTNPTNYFTVANFAMCAFSVHETGAVLADSVKDHPGSVFGWRTMFLKRLADPTFKPKFSDRSDKWDSRVVPSGATDRADLLINTPGGPAYSQTGLIKTMKKDGDDTVVTFTGTIVEDCIDWKETNKLRGWDSAGQPQYEQICLKRGHVEGSAPDDATMGTKLIDGFAKGMGVTIHHQFAEDVFNPKTKKYISILSVSVKGSPAETPIKE